MTAFCSYQARYLKKIGSSDVAGSKDLLQLQCHNRPPRSRCIDRHPAHERKMPLMSPRLSLLYLELGTAAGEYHYILRQRLGKLLVVVATLHSAIAATSSPQTCGWLRSFTAYYLVSQGKEPRPCAAPPDDLACLLGGLARLRSDRLGELLVAVGTRLDMLPSQGNQGTVVKTQFL